MSSDGRRAKRFLTAEEKYDLWVRMLIGQITTVQAAAEAGVDRTTIATLKRVARDGAIAALEASKPGRRKATAGENAELVRLRGEVDRLSAAIVEQAIELAALRGKAAWG
jgi:transposase